MTVVRCGYAEGDCIGDKNDCVGVGVVLGLRYSAVGVLVTAA